MKYAFFQKRLEYGAAHYYDSVLLRTRQPNIKYSYAVLIWDFSPIITVATTKKVLKLLKEALEMAKRLEEDMICIGSITRIKAEIMTIDTFVKDIQECINEIEVRVGSLEVLQKRADFDLIEADKLSSLKLFCLNI